MDRSPVRIDRRIPTTRTDLETAMSMGCRVVICTAPSNAMLPPLLRASPQASWQYTESKPNRHAPPALWSASVPVSNAHISLSFYLEPRHEGHRRASRYQFRNLPALIQIIFIQTKSFCRRGCDNLATISYTSGGRKAVIPQSSVLCPERKRWEIRSNTTRVGLIYVIAAEAVFAEIFLKIISPVYYKLV